MIFGVEYCLIDFYLSTLWWNEKSGNCEAFTLATTICLAYERVKESSDMKAG